MSTKPKKKIGSPCPFEIREEPDGVSFSGDLRSNRGHYRRALDELYETGGVLAFASKRGLFQIRKAAKAAGYVISFATRGSELLVRIDEKEDVKQ